MADSELQQALRDLEAADAAEGEAQQQSRPLRTGRRVVVKTGPEDQTVEVRAPDGSLEVEIRITDQGPVVRLSGARMEIDALDDLVMRCRRLLVEAEESADISSGGKLDLRAKGDLDLDAGGDFRATAETIWLN